MYSPQLAQDRLLETLPNNEEAAICAEYLFENQLVNLTQNLAGNRNRETISRNLFVLYQKGLCNRISRFKDDSNAHTRFYYWKAEPATKTYSDEHLLSERIKVILQRKGYSVDIEANTDFVDLVYMYKSYKKPANNSGYIDEFTKWFLHEVKHSLRSGKIHIDIIKRLTRTVTFLVKQSSQLKGKTYSNNKVEEIVPPISLNIPPVQRRNETLQQYLLRHLPRTVEKAVTSAELAFCLNIPLREKVVANTIRHLYLNNEVDRVDRTEMKPYRYWIGVGGRKTKTVYISSQEEVTSSRTQDIQLLVAGIQRAGHYVDPYVYGELASLEAQYLAWLELSDTYIISPNSITVYTYKADFVPTKIDIAVSKSLTKFLEELAGLPREDAMGVLAHLKEGTPKKAIEILRIANDETVMKRIESGRIPNFVDSIWVILSKGLEVFHPTIITKPTFLQWFIAQLGANPESITQSNVSTIKTHRLETIIKYDEKAQKLEKKHLLGYSSEVSPLVQMNPSSQQDIITRIKTVEDDITQIHERYAKIEGIIEEKELRGKLQKLEESKDKEQQKLDLLEEKLRKWNTDDLKCKSGILK